MAATPPLVEVLASARRQLAEGRPAAALQGLLAHEAELAGVPEFDYQLGLAALEAGDDRAALHALERVILQLPNHAGAWIDLAIAHIRLREYATAETLLAHVEDNFSPPADLLQHIQAARSQSRQARLAEGWHGEFTVQRGRVGNVNAGISTSGITLTPQGSAPVFLEIDPSRRPQADHASQWRGLLQRTVEHDAGSRSEWVGLMRGRQYDSAGDYDTRDIGLAYAYTRPLHRAPQDGALLAVLGGGLQHLQLGGRTLANIATVQLGLRQPLGRCSLALRLENEQRRFLADGYYDAGINWLGGGLLCAGEAGAFSLGLRGGLDKPESGRPGGATRRDEINLDYFLPLAGPLALEGLIYYGRAADREGYSPLLDNHRVRRIDRSVWRATLSWTLPWAPAGRWALQAGIERSREDANLSLFDVSDRQLFVGMRYRF